MNRQRLGLAVLFVLCLSVESWASVHTAITEVGADTENTISTASVLPGGTKLINGELINGEIDSSQDVDLLKFEQSAAAAFSTEILEISLAHDPFGHGLAGDDDGAADNNDLIENDSEILASPTTEALGWVDSEDDHNDIHIIGFYRVNVSQAVHTAHSDVIPEPTTFAVWSLLGLMFAGAGSRRRRA